MIYKNLIHFRFTLDSLCSYNFDIESISQFLLHYHMFNVNRHTPLNTLNNIDYEILFLIAIDSSLAEALIISRTLLNTETTSI